MLQAIDQGLAGVNAGFERMDKAAGGIARDGAVGDLVGKAVESMRARQEVAVNLAVIRKADETIGSLLDALA